MRAWRILAAALALLVATEALPAPDTNSTAALNPLYLRQQLAIFQSLSPERQEQIRKLDKELFELPVAERQHLEKIMERYVSWLQQMPEKNRALITASNSEFRLAAIKEQKSREWLETLPKAHREEYEATTNAKDRLALLEKWKLEDESRKERWHFAQTHWSEAYMVAAIESMEANKQLWNSYVINLSNQVNFVQKNQLLELSKAASKGDEIQKYELVARLNMLSHRTLLPGPNDGVRFRVALPSKLLAMMEEVEKKDKTAKKSWKNDVEPYRGQWPEFAVAVSEYLKRTQITPPAPLVKATTKSEMPAEVKRFIEEEIETKKGTPEGKEALEMLRNAEGKWPEYPRAIMKIAEKNNLFVPGWMIPKLPVPKKDKK